VIIVLLVKQVLQTAFRNALTALLESSQLLARVNVKTARLERRAKTPLRPIVRLADRVRIALLGRVRAPTALEERILGLTLAPGARIVLQDATRPKPGKRLVMFAKVETLGWGRLLVPVVLQGLMLQMGTRVRSAQLANTRITMTTESVKGTLRANSVPQASSVLLELHPAQLKMLQRWYPPSRSTGFPKNSRQTSRLPSKIHWKKRRWQR